MDTILLTHENNVATLTFNRPAKMNAFNMAMAKQLQEMIEEIREDPFVRVIVLRGAGEVFMAGNDLLEIFNKLDACSTEILAMIKHFNNSILNLLELKKPIISVVHGLVTGTGMSLMLASDLVLACADTQFSLGFIRIATTPVGGISFNLPRLVGSKKALELLLLSDNLTAEMAYSIGLINWVVREDQINAKLREITERLVNGPALAYAETKELLNSSWQNKVTTQLKLENESFLRSVNSRDFKSAVRAFVSKRQPEYEGR